MNIPSIEIWVALLVIYVSFMVMWYKGKLPTTGEIQDLTTILNSRGGNILILAGASVFFFYRAEHMYYSVVQMIKDGTIVSDNGIALNGLTFDTGAFGGAFGALLKTMSPDAPSPISSSSSGTTSTTTTSTKPPNKTVQTVQTTTQIVPAVSDVTDPSVKIENKAQTDPKSFL